MKVKEKNSNWSQLWKRNAVVAAIALFVCAAVYLNWDYEREQAGKVLGESTMVDSQTDALLGTRETLEEEAESAQEVLPEEAAEHVVDLDEQEPPAQESAYFATARLNRQQARDSALPLLQEAAAGEEADQAMRDQANETIQTMASYTVTEAQIENLVVAKGYADCVAFIGEESVSIAVAAPPEGLQETDTARIVDVVGQVTSFTPSQIKIIAVD